jgi:hypothetical protein
LFVAIIICDSANNDLDPTIIPAHKGCSNDPLNGVTISIAAQLLQNIVADKIQATWFCEH